LFPDVNAEAYDTLTFFSTLKSTEDFRKLLASRKFYENYQAEKHEDIDWIYRTLDNLLPLYENKLFKKSNNERWYQNRIWVMIDRLLDTVDNVSVVR
jgi:hypothetical protein